MEHLRRDAGGFFHPDMQFQPDQSIEILERTPAALSALLSGLSEAWTTPNEGPDTWSPYDVVGHLIHGEKTDWIPRMKMILEMGESVTFPPFDRFAQFRESQGKTLDQLLEEFTRWRVQNLRILKSVMPDAVALEKKGNHPAFGPVTLRQLLAAWVAHDLSHLAQIVRVMAKQYAEAVGPWQAYLPILQSSKP
jgi:hypothetical protein